MAEATATSTVPAAPVPANAQGAAQSNQAFVAEVRAVIADLSRHVTFCANNGHRDFVDKFRAAAERLEAAANKVKV